jgi:hypothetical protein
MTFGPCKLLAGRDHGVQLDSICMPQGLQFALLLLGSGVWAWSLSADS